LSERRVYMNAALYESSRTLVPPTACRPPPSPTAHSPPYCTYRYIPDIKGRAPSAT